MPRWILVSTGAAIVGACVVGVAVGTAKDDDVTTERPATTSEPPVSWGFEERARAAGIGFRTWFLPNEQGEHFKTNFYDHGAGLAVGDSDGDGLDDVYFCNQLGSNALYRNRGGGQFEDVTARSGPIALADRVSVSAVFADYDDDGREDLYVTTTMGNALFHNEGGGLFADATTRAGVELAAHSQSATFFDADGDGRLDLLVSNTASWTREFDPVGRYFPGGESLFDLVQSPTERNRFYRNRGDGTFEDATATSGLAGTGWSGDTAVFDFDEDGDADVLVVNMFGASHLFQNDGHAHFREVTREVLGKVSFGAVGAKAFDYDDDGHLDLLLVDMHSDMWMDPSYEPTPAESRRKFGGPGGPSPTGARAAVEKVFLSRAGVRADDVVFGNTLFHALGAGRFEEVSDRAGVETLWPWGIAAADFDDDGFVDAFLPSGMGYPFTFEGSALLMNRGDGTFVDRATEAHLVPMPGGDYARERIGGVEPARSSRSAATADFDGDGRPDLVVSNFNDRPLLLMNRFPRRNWVAFKLVGTRCNRDAVGAVVRLRVGARTLTRQVDAAGGYLAQSSLTLLFGLGDAATVDDCEITWPGNRKQHVTDAGAGRLHRVVELP